MYLIAKKKKGKAHYWTGTDTVCRLASTGGLDASRYFVSEAKHESRAVCHMCRQVSLGGKVLPTSEQYRTI